MRIKSGIYAGDLGLVELIEGGVTESSRRALVKLMPRMQEEPDDKGKTQLKLVTRKLPGQPLSKVIRPK